MTESVNGEMEAVRQAGMVHYQNMSPCEKDGVINMFQDLDADNDGRISKAEVRRFLNKAMPFCKISSLFDKLDEDGNGTLDFYEFRTFYYACLSRPVCDSCKELVMGLYYCCVTCWENYKNGREGEFQPFEVCSKCYINKCFKHRHPKFLDNCVLFRSKDIPELPKEKPMENKMREVLREGRLYYQALSPCEKNIAHSLFSEMALEGDGRVSVNEVINYLIRRGTPSHDACEAFEDIGMAGNSFLGFEDVVALWYVFVMRPRCERCRTMIMGCYYSCVDCLRMSMDGGNTNSFDLCAACYSRGEFSYHEHEVFLDNYVLLHMKNQLKGKPSNSGVEPGTLEQRSPMKRILVFMVKISAEAVLSASMGAVCNIM